MKYRYPNYTVFHKAEEVLLHLQDDPVSASATEDTWYDCEVEVVFKEGSPLLKNAIVVVARFDALVPPSPRLCYLILAKGWTDDWKAWKETVEQVNVVRIGPEISPPGVARKLYAGKSPSRTND